MITSVAVQAYLARIAELFKEQGHIESVKTFNFFPHTPHIENLVIF